MIVRVNLENRIVNCLVSCLVSPFVNPRNKPSRPLLFLLLMWLPLLGMPGQTAAQYVEDPYSAPVMAMGGALRILGNDASAIDLNPALLASLRTSLVQSDYRFFLEHNAHQATLSTVDNTSSPVGAGVLWRFSSAENIPGNPRPGWEVVGEDPDTTLRYQAQDYKVGVGIPLGNQFAIGTTFGWHRGKRTTEDIFDAISPSTAFLLTSSLQFRPSPLFAFALVGSNLLPTHRVELPTTATLAAAAQAGIYLMAEANLEVDFTSAADRQGIAATPELIRSRFHIGGGLLAREYFPVKVGYYRDGVTGDHFLCGGIGVSSPRVALHYAVRYRLNAEVQDLDGEPILDTSGRFMHLISLGIRFGPGGS